MASPGGGSSVETGAAWAREHAPAALGIAVLAVLGTFAAGVAIVSLRFSAAGLSGWRTVRTLSLGELFGAGATHVVVLSAVGVGALLLALWIDRKGTPLLQAVAATALGTAGVIVAILVFDTADATPRIVAGILTVLTGLVAAFVALATTPNAVHDWLRRHGNVLAIVAAAVAAVADAALWAAGEHLVAGVVLTAACVAAILLGLALIPAQPPGSVFRQVCRRFGGWVRDAAAPVAVGGLALAIRVLLGSWAAAAVVVLAGLLVAGLMWLIRRRRTHGWRFRRYAIGVVIAVEAFGVALAGLDAWQDPDVRPIAVLATDGTEVAGFLVTESRTSVYVGTARFCRRDPATLRLSPGPPVAGSGAVTAIALGDVRERQGAGPTAIRSALPRAQGLLDVVRARAGLPRRRRDACAGEGPLDLRPRAGSHPLDPRRAAALARRYRPILKFDSTERWRPLNVDRFLDEQRAGEPIHRVCVPGGDCRPLTSGAEFDALPKNAFINIEGVQLEGADARSPDLATCPEPQPASLRDRLLDCDRGSRSAIYYHAVEANGRVYIDYWWFLRYNHFADYRLGRAHFKAPELCRNRLTGHIRNSGLECNEHEGDWEGVTAVTARNDPNRLEFVDYAEHTIVRRFRLDQLQHDGDRAVVYVAEGSHAAYATKCPRNCGQFERILGGIRRPEANTDGADDWGRNDQAECDRGESCLQPLPTGSWGAFRGFWGSRACVSARRNCELGVPPTAPATQPRYTFPWCYVDERARRLTCDPAGP